MERELSLGSEPVAHAQATQTAQKGLTARLQGVDADGHVHRVGRADVREPKEPIEVRAVGGQPYFGDVAVVGHAGVGAPIARDAAEHPLVTRGRGLVPADRRGLGPVRRVPIDEAASGERGHRGQDEHDG